MDAHGRLQAGYTVTNTVTGEPDGLGGDGCDPASEAAGNAYRCFGSDNGVYDPCWLDTGQPGTVVADCLEEPWSNQVTRVLLSSPPSPPTSPDGGHDSAYPWGVQLSTGQQCVAIQGAHDTFDGQAVNYHCGTNLDLVGAIDRSRLRWTAATARYDNGYNYTAGPRAQITIAWYG